MKVLHLLDNSNLGGIQEMILRLHKHSRHRHDFCAADGSMAQELRDSGMVLWGEGVPEAAMEQYQVIVGHGVGGWAYDGNFAAAHAAGKKTVEVMHSVARSLTEPWQVDKFIALSDQCLRINRHMPRAQRIYVPIPTDEFEPFGGMPGIYNSSDPIGKLSRLVPEKCPALFARLAAHFPEQCFLLAGEGPERQVIEQRFSSPNLDLLGTVRDLPAYYRRLKLYVYPTSDECCSASVAQAQAAGLPVICQNIPALRETTGGYAWFCHTEYDFQLAIEAYLTNPLPFYELGRLGYHWARDHFDVSITVKTWDTELERLVQGS